ncbi:hypothetical protein Tco_0973434 [Tanacetum coccineum]
MRTASIAAKPCQEDSSEFYLITGSIYTDQRGTVAFPIVATARRRKRRSVKVKELQERCIIKAFKLKNQEKYEHVGPKVTSAQDGKISQVDDKGDLFYTFPVIARITPEITAFLNALRKQKEEQRLFQFLNGLEEKYSHQRSQFLMINPLPNVENAFSLIQQEESQRMLFGSVSNVEATALFSKGGAKDKCSICGFKWHPPEKCWEKVGYPA